MGVNLTSHLYQASRLRKGGSILLFPLYVQQIIQGHIEQYFVPIFNEINN